VTRYAAVHACVYDTGVHSCRLNSVLCADRMVARQSDRQTAIMPLDYCCPVISKSTLWQQRCSGQNVQQGLGRHPHLSIAWTDAFLWRYETNQKQFSRFHSSDLDL